MTTLTVVELAPIAAFVVVVLFGAGLYRTLNQGGLLARRRIAAFSPAMGMVPLPIQSTGSALISPKRFSAIPFLDRLLQRNQWGDRLALELARADLPLRVGEYLLIRWLLAAVLGAAVAVKLEAPLLGAIGALVGYVLPALYVRWCKNRRLRAFDEQLVDALLLVANALKSGYSFLQGMEAVAREVPKPLGAEFGEALREIRIGGSVEDALQSMAQRIQSTDLDLVVTAMIIQRQVGGNLTEILTKISYTVRERHRILREIKVLTAQERMSGNIIAALPVVLVLLMAFTSPEYVPSMWGDPAGRIILALGGVFEVLGLVLIRRLVWLEV
jgi:tight adherence protein B